MKVDNIELSNVRVPKAAFQAHSGTKEGEKGERRSPALYPCGNPGKHPAQLPGGGGALRSELGRFPAGDQRRHRSLSGRACRQAVAQHPQAAPRRAGPVACQPGFPRSDQDAAGAPGNEGHPHPASTTGAPGRAVAAAGAGTLRRLAGGSGRASACCG
ncbi:hypothetical protein D3C78_1461900 [compost metagenome]